MLERSEVSADVLVIGGGMAGAMAALEAAKHGCRVVLVDKGVLGRSGSSCTSGGALAFPSSGPGTTETGDSPDCYYDDIMAGGEGMSDPSLVRCLVEEIADRVQGLMDIGLRFQRRADGRLYQRQGLGHRFPRSCSVDGDGPGLMLGLRREVLHRGVQVWEDTGVFQLLKSGGAVAAAAGLHLPSGRVCLFRAGATVLAAGSATGLYRYASANYQTQGDSFALALDAGAELASLEFVEFTFVPAPKGVFISSGGATPFPSRGAHLYNGQGERFMARYDPVRMERATRATVVQAMGRETREGRGPILMDATVISPEYRQTLEGSEVLKKIRSVGVDPWRERFEWRPAVHSILGGVVISADTATSVPGLFACGEASTGVHGANRLSGVALAECAVFGHRAGRSAAAHAAQAGRAALSAALVDPLAAGAIGPGGKTNAASLARIRAELGELAWAKIGIFRNQAGLREAAGAFAQALAALSAETRVSGAAELAELYSLRHMALTGLAIALAADLRQETRGQHLREDYPGRDDRAWGSRRVLVGRAEGGQGLEVRARTADAGAGNVG